MFEHKSINRWLCSRLLDISTLTAGFILGQKHVWFKIHWAAFPEKIDEV